MEVGYYCLCALPSSKIIGHIFALRPADVFVRRLGHLLFEWVGTTLSCLVIVCSNLVVVAGMGGAGMGYMNGGGVGGNAGNAGNGTIGAGAGMGMPGSPRMSGMANVSMGNVPSMNGFNNNMSQMSPRMNMPQNDRSQGGAGIMNMGTLSDALSSMNMPTNNSNSQRPGLSQMVCMFILYHCLYARSPGFPENN